MSIAGQTLNGALPSGAPVVGECSDCYKSTSLMSPPNVVALGAIGAAALIIMALMSRK